MIEIKEFKDFILEGLNVGRMKSSGVEAARHTKKYVKPYIGKKGTHTVASDAGHVSSGDTVSIHSHKIIGGVHHVEVSKAGSSKRSTIPTSKLHKPKVQSNKGFDREDSLVTSLNKSGLMKGKGAGASGGTDFHLIDKRPPKPERKIPGTQGIISGETKSHINNSDFGQITLSRHPETNKWHLSDKNRAKHPEYAAEMDKARVKGPDGKHRSIVDHLNKHEPPGTSNKGGIKSTETNLDPAHAYLKGHGAGVVHLASHGTFSAKKGSDPHNTGLPKMKGTGSFRVRQKTHDSNKRMVHFRIKSLNKSPVHLGTPEGVEHIKKKLGHYANNNELMESVKHDIKWKLNPYTPGSNLLFYSDMEQRRLLKG